MKCGVWSAERGERPAEGDGVWRLGSGAGAAEMIGASVANQALRLVPVSQTQPPPIVGQASTAGHKDKPARCIADSKGHSKRFQRFFQNKFQSIPMLSNRFQPIPTLFLKKI